MGLKSIVCLSSYPKPGGVHGFIYFPQWYLRKSEYKKKSQLGCELTSEISLSKLQSIAPSAQQLNFIFYKN